MPGNRPFTYKNYCLFACMFLFSSFCTMQCMNLLSDDVKKLSQIPGTLKDALAHTAQDTANGVVNNASKQVQDVAIKTVNQAGMWSFLSIIQLNRLTNNLRLFFHQSIWHCSKEYTEAVKMTVDASRAVAHEGKKAAHEIIEHTGDKAKDVVGASVMEITQGADRIFNQVSLFRDETLASTAATIGFVGGMYGAYKNLDNASPKKSLFCSTLGLLSGGYILYQIHDRKRARHKCTSNSFLRPSITHQQQNNICITPASANESTSMPITARTPNTTHPASRNPFYRSMFGDKPTLAAKMTIFCSMLSPSKKETKPELVFT